MFRKKLIDDLQKVFDVDTVRITRIDDETEVLFFNPITIVSTPAVGSGKTHFRVYGELAINQDEANGVFGYLEHRYQSCNSELKDKFKLMGDATGELVNLYDQHWIRSTLPIVWESDIEWNEAPNIQGGRIEHNKYEFCLHRLEKYLFSADVKNQDYDYAVKFFEDNFHNKKTTQKYPTGGCSSFRKGNFYGRNYDWYYSKNPVVVVHATTTDNRHESISVCNSLLTANDLVMGQWNDMMKLIPFMVLDGINDSGVFCNINVVPAGDKGKTTGTNSGLDGDYIPVSMLPKLILDKCSSAIQAVELCMNAKVYGLYNDNTAIECHIMIGDKDNTYVVEFINNTPVVIDISGRPYLTNFYMDGASFTQDNHIDINTITQYGSGVERYNKITDNIESVVDIDSTFGLLKKLYYTNLYKLIDSDEIWKTDLSGPYADMGSARFPNLTAQDPIEKYRECGIIDFAKQSYINRDRTTSGSWQTVSSSVYDIEHKSLLLAIQEGITGFSFNFEQKD